ncbi:MAG: response regulator [Armatimonadetes bacterium]|nr:response regulator [Armatimonadota bacterium]
MARVLVIDDEEGMCWALEKALEEEGHQVFTATCGLAGLAVFKAQEIDLVLCDIKMPDISGLEVLEQIRKKNPYVPVVIMTGYSSLPIALEAIKKGANSYLTKPFHIIQLKELVQKTINQQPCPSVH